MSVAVVAKLCVAHAASRHGCSGDAHARALTLGAFVLSCPAHPAYSAVSVSASPVPHFCSWVTWGMLLGHIPCPWGTWSTAVHPILSTLPCHTPPLHQRVHGLSCQGTPTSTAGTCSLSIPHLFSWDTSDTLQGHRNKRLIPGT